MSCGHDLFLLDALMGFGAARDMALWYAGVYIMSITSEMISRYEDPMIRLRAL